MTRSHAHFGDVSLLQVDAVLLQRREVPAAVVDGDAGWESDAFLHLLAFVDL